MTSGVDCSVCNVEFSGKYCSVCGQYKKGKRISTLTLLEDLFGGIYSLEKSFFKNVKIALKEPNKLVQNYWNGYRGYYYSPSRFLVIAALFFVVQLSIKNDFFGIVVSSASAQQFTMLIVYILVLSTMSFIFYLRKKKSFYEHLIMNIYHVSLWALIFVPLAIGFGFLDIAKVIDYCFLGLYLLMVITWNARVFYQNKVQVFWSVLLQCCFWILIFYLIYQKYTS